MSPFISCTVVKNKIRLSPLPYPGGGQQVLCTLASNVTTSTTNNPIQSFYWWTFNVSFMGEKISSIQFKGGGSLRPKTTRSLFIRGQKGSYHAKLMARQISCHTIFKGLLHTKGLNIQDSRYDWPFKDRRLFWLTLKDSPQFFWYIKVIKPTGNGGTDQRVKTF